MVMTLPKEAVRGGIGQRVEEGRGRGTIAEIEGEHPAAGAQDPLCDGELRVARQARVVDRANRVLALQETSHSQRALGVTLHAHVQGGKAAQDQERAHRSHAAAGVDLHAADGRDPSRVADDHTAEHI